MTTTQITVDTAPRDLEGLKKIGRFNLRLVAQQLGVFATEAAKAAFMQQPNDAQAETVKKLLDAHFGTKTTGSGGGGKAAGTGRQPSTKNAGKATTVTTTAEPAAEEAASTSSGSGGKAAGGGGGENAAKLLAAIQGIRDDYAGLREAVENLTASINQLQGISAGTNRFVAMSIGLTGKLAEQVLGAPLEQVLEVVVDDMPAVENAMRSMPGADEAEEGGEEESEEGNGEE